MLNATIAFSEGAMRDVAQLKRAISHASGTPGREARLSAVAASLSDVLNTVAKMTVADMAAESWRDSSGVYLHELTQKTAGRSFAAAVTDLLGRCGRRSELRVTFVIRDETCVVVSFGTHDAAYDALKAYALTAAYDDRK